MIISSNCSAFLNLPGELIYFSTSRPFAHGTNEELTFFVLFLLPASLGRRLEPSLSQLLCSPTCLCLVSPSFHPLFFTSPRADLPLLPFLLELRTRTSHQTSTTRLSRLNSSLPRRAISHPPHITHTHCLSHLSFFLSFTTYDDLESFSLPKAGRESSPVATKGGLLRSERKRSTSLRS